MDGRKFVIMAKYVNSYFVIESMMFHTGNRPGCFSCILTLASTHLSGKCSAIFLRKDGLSLNCSIKDGSLSIAFRSLIKLSTGVCISCTCAGVSTATEANLTVLPCSTSQCSIFFSGLVIRWQGLGFLFFLVTTIKSSSILLILMTERTASLLNGHPLVT